MFRSPYMKLQTTRSKIQEPNKSEIPILKSEKNIQRFEAH